MKINYISTYSLPSKKAMGVQIMNTCDGLVKNGNVVKLYVPNKKEDTEKIFSFYGLKPTFEITESSKIVPGNNVFSHVWNSLKYLKNIKIEEGLVYSREQLTGIVFPGFIFEVHALPKKVTFWHKWLWGKASGFVVLTPFIKKELVKAGFSEEKIHVAPDAIGQIHLDSNISKEEARKRHNLPNNKKIVGYVGKYKTPFAKSKGVPELISAFAELSDAALLLVGMDKKYQNEIKNEIRKNKISEDSVFVVDHVSQEEVVEYLHAADVLVMNYPWSEHHAYQMSPMKLFEYMAAEKPIIASKLPSICEVLSKENSILIDPNDNGALADSLKDILKDEDRADKIAKRARQGVQDMTWEERARGITNFLSSLVK